MEVRFRLKGNQEETVFSLIEGREDKVYLHAIGLSSEEITIPLCVKEGSHVLTLALGDYPRFEESPAMIDERLLGLSSEWMEMQENGFDAEGDSSTDSPKPGYSPDDIFVENKPFSLKQLIDLIESKDIELDPSFQRNFVWDNTRQSRLIESLFLGLPLPSIYLSQYDDGTLTIVDGLQRLNTIRKFFKDELQLSNLEYLDECNGKTFSQLAEVLSPLRIRRFGQTQIMCFVIDYRSPNKLKYDLFRRLNTGGKPLNNQEIRNCLSRRPLQQALKEMVNAEEFVQATDGSVKDTRMDAQESALRFMYFYDQYREDNVVGAYAGNMDSALDEYVERANRQTDFQDYIATYQQSLRDAFVLFGKYAFRKVYPNYAQTRRNQVNKLLMTTICVLLAKHRASYQEGIARGINLTDQLADLLANDSEFFNSITSSTNAKYNIAYVFKTIKEALFDPYLR